jgi:hypothetical protein
MSENVDERAMSLVVGGKRGGSYRPCRGADRKTAKNSSPGVQLSPTYTTNETGSVFHGTLSILLSVLLIESSPFVTPSFTTMDVDSHFDSYSSNY